MSILSSSLDTNASPYHILMLLYITLFNVIEKLIWE